MIKNKIEDILWQVWNHEIEPSVALSAVEAYSSASNGSKPDVSGSLPVDILVSELREIPKLKDFASGHSDSQGYARLCGQEILLERLIKKARRQ